jgi:hypothetical protein
MWATVNPERRSQDRQGQNQHELRAFVVRAGQVGQPFQVFADRAHKSSVSLRRCQTAIANTTMSKNITVNPSLLGGIKFLRILPLLCDQILFLRQFATQLYTARHP